MNNVNQNKNVPSDAHFMALCGVRAARAPAPMGPALAFRLVIRIFRGSSLMVSASAWQSGPLFCFRSLIPFFRNYSHIWLENQNFFFMPALRLPCHNSAYLRFGSVTVLPLRTSLNTIF